MLTLGANLLFVAILVSVLELLGWFTVARPFDAYLPSWQFHHVRKPNSILGRRDFFAVNTRTIPYFKDSDRWHFNRQGWLAKTDISTTKEPNSYRIFYVGDSFIEGNCRQEDALPQLIQKRLRRMVGKGSFQIDVVNAGTASYCPSIYYILLRHKIIDLKPDLVVVVVDMTDDYDEWKYRGGLIVDKEGNPLAAPFRNVSMGGFVDTELGAVRATIWTRLILFLHTKSYFFSMLQHLMAEHRDPATLGSDETEREFLYRRWAWCEETWDAQTSQNVDQMFDILRRLVRLCRENEIKLLLTAVPHYRQYHGDLEGRTAPSQSARPHYELERLADQMSVPYLNAYQALRPAVEGSEIGRYYYAHDIHFTGAGNRLWAEKHVQFLADPSTNLLHEDLYQAVGADD